MPLTLTSPRFADNEEIPRRYTCEGDDISPPLHWSDVPSEAKSLALINDDPDAPNPAAPKRVWVHWVLYNMPRDTAGLAEGVGGDDLPTGTLEGRNDWKKLGYGGPCPPVGRHRHFFRLYALDCVLADLAGPTKKKLLETMQGHVVGEATLVGLYQKSGK